MFLLFPPHITHLIDILHLIYILNKSYRFTDDTLDLPWRVKMFIPLFAAGPLISTYDGLTSLSVPEPFNTWLINESTITTPTHTILGRCLGLIPGVIVDLKGHGKVVELGYLFKGFIACLAIFCTNAINILAGRYRWICDALTCLSAYSI